MPEKKRLVVIDANAVIHRAYHALPPLTTKKGERVNAVYGFLLVLFRVLKELRPDCAVSAFDHPSPTFRHKKFADYKAKRPKTPEDLSSQIPKIKEILNVFNILIFEKEGFEADDIIGTICRQAGQETETIIVSGDLDVLQLAEPSVKIYLLRKGVKDMVLYDEKLVKEKYRGLEPSQLVDFKALRGDPSDNIGGVKGIGEKTATDLLLKFGSLENLYKKISQVKPKTKELLLGQKEEAFLSRLLAQIEKNVPINFDPKECQQNSFNREKAVGLLEALEFHSLIKRLPVSPRGESENFGGNLRLW